MSKQEPIEMTGEVIDALRDAQFRVEFDNGHTVICHLSGKIRRFRINIVPGDRVDVELSPYDLTKGRIVYRHN